MTKVNLIHGEGDVLDTHLNINPFTKKTEDGLLVRGDLTNIDKYVDDAFQGERGKNFIGNKISFDKACSEMNFF